MPRSSAPTPARGLQCPPSSSSLHHRRHRWLWLPTTPKTRPLTCLGWTKFLRAHLEHAHGSAQDIPDLLRGLADPFGDWDQTLDKLFGDDLLHQGTCYSATAPALPFLSRLITSGALPAKQRLDLYVWLLVAADRWADGLLADADRAAAEGRLPQPEASSLDVRSTVDEQLPALLTRWETEPPAAKFVLACLAALFPHHGRQIGDQITRMAQKFDGTQAGRIPAARPSTRAQTRRRSVRGRDGHHLLGRGP